MKILVVDDEDLLVKGIRFNLRSDGYDVISGTTGLEAVSLTQSEQPDLIVLDVMMPEMDGLTACAKIREFSEVPIILLTAKADDMDKLIGFDHGADDYLTKPFSVEELLARLRVTQRRLALMQNTQTTSSIYKNGQLRVDYASGCVYFADEELHLTPMEYKLLCLLSRNTGKVLTHKYILQHVWGRSLDSDVGSLRVFMATLRKKLEKAPDSPQYIQTHVGIGYRMMKVE